MQARHLVVRGLTYYWRTNVAVVIGVATAVAVLAGALLVGDSVRGSLRDLVLQRLGRTDLVVASVGFFREALADDVRQAQAFRTTFREAAPLVIVPGFVTAQESGRRVGDVRVYGVDERFWAFHGVAREGPADRDAFLSPALAARAQRSTRQHDPGTGAAAVRSPARIGARSQGRSRSDTPAHRSSSPAVSSHGRVLSRGAAG